MPSGFKIICSNCGKIVELIPDHKSDDSDISLCVGGYEEDGPMAVLECTCGNQITDWDL